MPRAALGVDLATPMATLRRGSDWQAGLARPYADGPDFWPSVYRLALGVVSHSCSVLVSNQLLPESLRNLYLFFFGSHYPLRTCERNLRFLRCYIASSVASSSF
jgi:hypothetical protein